MKEAIIEEWANIPQEIIDKCIDAFKRRLRCVIEVEARHIEQYLFLIIQIDTFTICICKIWYDFDQSNDRFLENCFRP